MPLYKDFSYCIYFRLQW